jgi:hypothetical protein
MRRFGPCGRSLLVIKNITYYVCSKSHTCTQTRACMHRHAHTQKHTPGCMYIIAVQCSLPPAPHCESEENRGLERRRMWLLRDRGRIKVLWEFQEVRDSTCFMLGLGSRSSCTLVWTAFWQVQKVANIFKKEDFTQERVWLTHGPTSAILVLASGDLVQDLEYKVRNVDFFL